MEVLENPATQTWKLAIISARLDPYVVLTLYKEGKTLELDLSKPAEAARLRLLLFIILL